MLEQAELKKLFRTARGELYSRTTGKRVGHSSGGGYRQVSIRGRRYPEHRVIWMLLYGSLPEKLDHINGVKDDNRPCNLRPATDSQNSHNSRRTKSPHGYKGVVFNKTRQEYYARITVDGLVSSRGFFQTPADAARAYDEMAKELLGDYAHLNFSEGKQNDTNKSVKKVPGKKRVSPSYGMQLKLNQD